MIVPFFAVAGLRAQAQALHSGGRRAFSLPDTGADPTDTYTVSAAFRARRRELVPERRLVLAVFMTALDDLRYPREARPYQAAVRWLDADDETWPLSFVSCCSTLELDAALVRKRVRAALAARGAA